MLKLAMLLNNPGEPAPETRYRDPVVLRDLGYNGLVCWESTSLSGVERPDLVGSGEMRRWVETQLDQIREKVQGARAAGLDAYINYDVLTLAREATDRHAPELLCKNRSNHLCPASERAWEVSTAALEALLRRLPELQGVIVRFGDSDARRFPYLLGNDIYLPHCPRCSGLSPADRISIALHRFHDLIVAKLGKRLIARAWNVRPGGMHDSPALCEELRDRLPGSPDDANFILSFKFTESDFWRYQRWNPASLVFGRRPILYELQCQREFEGKGAMPNWQVPLWRDGAPESVRPGEPAGLAQVAGKVNLAGLWAWVRGGGWGGPFVQSEAWIDANVTAVPSLADDPQADLDVLAERWIRNRLGVQKQGVAAALHQILAHSPDNILKAFYIGPYAAGRASSWHPNGDWVQDDLLDARAAWRLVQRLPESQLDAVVREKVEAVEQLAQDRAALQRQMGEGNHSLLEPLVSTMIYAESLFEALRDLLEGLVAYRRYLRTRSPAMAELCRGRLQSAQGHWQHHTQRHATLPGCATAFREANLWDLTQEILAEVSE